MYLITGLSGSGKGIYSKFLAETLSEEYYVNTEIVHLDYLNGYMINPTKYRRLIEESPILKSYVSNVLYPNPPYNDIDWDNDSGNHIRDFLIWLNEKEKSKSRNRNNTLYIVEGIQIFNVIDPYEFLVDPIVNHYSIYTNKLHVLDRGFMRSTKGRLHRRFGKQQSWQSKKESVSKKIEHVAKYDLNPAQVVEWIRFLKFKNIINKLYGSVKEEITWR